MTPDERRKKNLRLALVLASIAIVFFLGFFAKLVFFSQ
jgi:hypothetical protein